MAHFVGSFEIVCGLLVLLGLLTRLAAVPLLIVICTAMVSTKIPELFRANQGFWYMVSDARTDFAMLCSLLFLILAGGGRWSLHWQGQRKREPGELR
jgi:putative oxidoreductase